ncbi:MAG: hypothetical protein WBD16_08695 [Pyrinomonadaceae bacterium]
MKKTDLIKTQSWTNLWKKLGVPIHPKKKQRQINDVKNINTRQKKRLRRLGIEKDLINRVANELDAFKEPLLFYKFCEFFLHDTFTMQEYLGGKSPKDAFNKLFNIFKRNNFDELKERLFIITIFHKRNKKGEGRIYFSKAKSKIPLKRINTGKITGVLNHSSDVDYGVVQDTLVFKNSDKNDERVICIVKGKTEQVNKFISITKSNGYFTVRLSFDTNAEYNRVKAQIEKALGTFLDSNEQSGDITKFRDFIKTGTSSVFEMIGVNIEDNDLFVSLNKTSHAQTTLQDSSFWKTIKNDATPEDKIWKITLRTGDSSNRLKFPLSILTRRQGVLGAVFVKLEDRGLRADQRKRINTQFETEFAFPLNTFISNEIYDSEEEYFKHYLQKDKRLPKRLEARSPRALEIYKELLELKIITDQRERLFGERFCTQCSQKYKPQGVRSYCDGCGATTFSGKDHEIANISEHAAATFILKKITEKLNIKGDVKSRRYEGTILQTISLNIDDIDLKIIIQGTSLSADKIKLIKLKSPARFVITALTNKSNLASENIIAEDLYSILFNLSKGGGTQINNLIVEARKKTFSRVRENAQESRQHILDDDFYQKKKTHGPGLFEAHISTMLHEIFGNSVWLGSANPGAKVPDGITAVPLMDSKKGCFIWDAKYTKKKEATTNPEKKDAEYIRIAKRSDSVSRNGGLKAFIYISNKDHPKNFVAKYSKRIGLNHFRYIFMKTSQLAKIYDHFQKHGGIFTSDPRTKETFAAKWSHYLFSGAKKNGGKVLVMTDNQVDALLTELEKQYSLITAPKLSISQST